MRRWLLLPLAAVLLLALSSCERRPRKVPEYGQFEIVTATIQGSIPAEYGRLVGVTSSDSYPGWAQLWFERDDGAINVVYVDFIKGRTQHRVMTIPRS